MSVRDALQELVRLKDIKEKMESSSACTAEYERLHYAYRMGKDAAWDAARAALAAEQEPRVPREPTEAMLTAGWRWYYGHTPGPKERDELADAWRAMYDAALAERKEKA